MNHSDIRWMQRFQNFSRAFLLLQSALESRELNEFSDLEQEGIIQRFEYTFELAWKTLKDYLDYSDIILPEATPRKVIKECASLNIFENAGIIPEIYLDMLTSRNLLSHSYDLELFKREVKNIKEKYVYELEKQHLFLSAKIAEIEEEGKSNEQSRT